MSSTATSLVPTPVRNIGSALSKALPTPMQTAPSTPSSQPAGARPSPGTFRHPRFTEIIQRQNKTLLTQGNVRSAVVNASALVLSVTFRDALHTIISTTFTFTVLSQPSAGDTASIVVYLIWILLSANIVLSLRQTIPYISKKDTIEDIPLTPSQRALLGLPPSASSTPVRTGSPFAASPGYVPPPRYHRRISSNNSTSSSTPNSSDRRSISANYGGTPSRGTFSNNIPFSPPSGGSPLFHKAIERQQRRQSQSDFDLTQQRNSYGTGAEVGGLSRSNSMNARSGIAGSPVLSRTGTGARKGVNFKWMYDQQYNLAGGSPGGTPARGLATSQSMHF